MTEYRDTLTNVSEHLNNHSFSFYKTDANCISSVNGDDKIQFIEKQSQEIKGIEINSDRSGDYFEIGALQNKANHSHVIETLQINSHATTEPFNLAEGHKIVYIGHINQTELLTQNVNDVEKINQKLPWNNVIDEYRGENNILQEIVFTIDTNHRADVNLQNSDKRITYLTADNSIQSFDNQSIPLTAEAIQPAVVTEAEIAIPKDVEPLELETPIEFSSIDNQYTLEEDRLSDNSDYPAVDVLNIEDKTVNHFEPYDESILKEPPTKPRKKRRRIVLLNEEESDQSAEEEEKNRILKTASPVLGQPRQEEPSLRNIDEIVENEKPGPKSKKASTQLLKELQARALLRSAIVIPATDVKKYKKRIINSDDEEFNVDDIGIPDLGTDTDLNHGTSILINENENFTVEGIEIDKVDKIVPIENPILPQNSDSFEDELETTCGEEDYYFGAGKLEPKEEYDSTINNMKNEVHSLSPQSFANSINEKSNNMEQMYTIIKQENQTSTAQYPAENFEDKPQELNNSFVEDVNESYLNSLQELENNAVRDSGNSTDSTNNIVTIKEESDIKDSSDEDEFIPNDVYFGTPDKVVTNPVRGRGRPRGRPPLNPSGTRSIPYKRPENDKTKSSTQRGRGGRRGRPPLHQFIDNRRSYSSSRSSSSGSHSSSNSSESDSHDSYRKAKHKSKSTLHNYEQAVVISTVKKKKKDKGRFYDKSREIPNEIYFGDVDVPLHVLYSYGTSASSDSSEEEIVQRPIYAYTPRGRGRGAQAATVNRIPSSGPSRRGRPPGTPNTNVSPNGDRLIKTMKKFLKAAGIKKVKFNKLWEGCKSHQDRANKILELLREKGLEGEPTILKCKQLRKEILTKKEIEDLDPNLILQTEGRTRRSAARAATRRNYTYDEDEAQETMSKLKKVIDSDSDFD